HLLMFTLFSRDDKRYTEKKNKSERARRKKEDTAKLRGFVDLTLSLDPRIKRIKQEEKEAREAKKRGGSGKKTKQQEAEEKKKLEEEARKKEEEEKVCEITKFLRPYVKNVLVVRLLVQRRRRRRLRLRMLRKRRGELLGLQRLK